MRLVSQEAPRGETATLASIAFGIRSQVWAAARVAARALRPLIGDDGFDRLYGWGRVGYLPNVQRPETFVEKLLWLKRHFRHPDMPRLSDKLAVRDYVRERAPGLRLTRIFTESTSAATFDFDALPSSAVLKPTHTSGHVAFWGPGADRERLRVLLADWLARRYDRHLDEWFYGSITPRVFAEQDLRDPLGHVPADYKVFVLNGTAHAVQVFEGRGQQLVRTMFDRDWTPLPVYRSARPGGPPIHVPASLAPPRPTCLDGLLTAAEQLAEPFPFVRVDMYVVADEPYFGEMTFLPAGGYVPLEPKAFDRALGAHLTLPEPLGIAAP